MTASWIVEAIDIGGDLIRRQGAILVDLLLDVLFFQAAEK